MKNLANFWYFFHDFSEFYLLLSRSRPLVQAKYAIPPDIAKLMLSCIVTIAAFSSKIASIGISTRIAMPTISAVSVTSDSMVPIRVFKAGRHIINTKHARQMP